jgi:VIT1/CCC1 family predicted Fe2+/Mn2+ transporter
LKHHDLWKEYTGQSANPSSVKIWFYYLISRILGLTFGIKLMEKREELAQETYAEIGKVLSLAKVVAEDEEEHEKELIGLIEEERLNYAGDIVRGLNVALVELTGTLAGLTLAVPDSQLIVAAGLIAGTVMSLSVASTEYLAATSTGGVRSPLKAVVYACFTNVFTVLFLVSPYLIFSNIYLSLASMVSNAILVILLFSFYISVVNDMPFRKRFREMLFMSLGVAALAFVIGLVARALLHVEV